MINDDAQQHPWHLHGYSLDFIDAGKLPSVPPPSCDRTRQQQQQQRTNVSSLSNILPPIDSRPTVLTVGDSFNIPRDSYVLFRFTANNPGPWFLHCHMDWHISPGLAMVFSVARNQSYGDLVDPPPDSFPRCGPRQRLLRKPTTPSINSSATVTISVSSRSSSSFSLPTRRLRNIVSILCWLKLFFF